MSLISLLIFIAVVCIVAYLFLRYVVPAFPVGVRPLVIAIAALILIILILQVTGLLPDIGGIRVGK